MAMKPRHFLDIDSFSDDVIRSLIEKARELKQEWLAGGGPTSYCAGRVLIMIFEKPSTRTRISFDVAMRQIGGGTISVNSGDMQLGRGETIADTAKVLSRYGNAIMLRTNTHASLLELAEHSTIPVINGLTDKSHPCQIMADILTFEEQKGQIAGRTVAWIGDGNNVANSWIHAAVRFGFALRIACPEEFRPNPALFDWVQAEGGNVKLTTDPKEAVSEADAVVTDVWVSMGQKDAEKRFTLLAPYQVTAGLMAQAAPGAIFMHCLPAERGREVTAEVIDGPQSVVFDEAENRLHAQKAILAWCLETQ